mmetsp:Transcript_11120/g.21190  ORF Transcript_11120/g.21190 Transcript_11120/m.21190 type:complete len:464 (-) Transcript_11120:1033-2424(-)
MATTVVATLEVRRKVGRTPQFKQPVELTWFSKFREHYEYDRRNLKTFVPPQLPVDLNQGYERFCDRDRNNPYPAPLHPICEGLRRSGQMEELRKADFVTWRGNIAKVLCTPWNRFETWHMEVTYIAGTIFLNVKEPPENLMPEETRDARTRKMCFWGFSFEEFCTGATETQPIDSTEGFCSVVKTQVGSHRVLLGAEMDCCWDELNNSAQTACRDRNSNDENKRALSSTPRYIELKTTKIMNTPNEVMKFERNKLIKWWAQSFPAGVMDILVGFRDDAGVVRNTQVLKTLALPRSVAGKRHAWDANVSICFLEDLLSWLKGQILADMGDKSALNKDASTTCPPIMYRLQYEPKCDRSAVTLYHDPDVPSFVPDHARRYLMDMTAHDMCEAQLEGIRSSVPASSSDGLSGVVDLVDIAEVPVASGDQAVGEARTSDRTLQVESHREVEGPSRKKVCVRKLPDEL